MNNATRLDIIAAHVASGEHDSARVMIRTVAHRAMVTAKTAPTESERLAAFRVVVATRRLGEVMDSAAPFSDAAADAYRAVRARI